MSSFENLEPLSARPTSAVIADRILSGIMDGSLPSGSKLSEAKLAERLGVSRGPIREALQRLIAQGVLVAHRSRGTFVATLEPEDVRDVYRCRTITEQAAVRLLVSDADIDLSPLDDALERLGAAAKQGDWARVAEVDLQFHELLVVSSGSKRLARMFSTLLVETRMCITALESAYPDPENIVPQHRDMLRAIRDRDEVRALHLVEQHMLNAVALQVGAGDEQPAS